MKFMSFNLRYDNPNDGINSFTNRIPRVIDTIKKENPDVIGFQEVTDSMRKTMRDNLSDYVTIGCGRESNYHGESMLIAYKKDCFELIEVKNVWLSETPTVPGTKYGFDHSGCPRMYTAIRIKHDSVEKPFWFVNTHLDHEGATARVLEATQLCRDLMELDGNFVLTGDFNATPNAPEIKLITEALGERGCVDCTADLGVTFHCFGLWPLEKRIKIDYIFTDAICKNAHRVDDIPVNGQYYSDHNAVCAEIEL